MTGTAPLLRRIPKVDLALASSELEPLVGAYPRTWVLAALREDLDELRRGVLAGERDAADLALAAVRDRVAERLAERRRPFYRRVLNATGVILHTGLGRAPLPDAAVAALAATAAHPQRVEIDLDSGQRGGRDEGCARLVRELTGCEAATVVNNNAAATVVILAALARGKKVLLSRGEMVEIGGSFRIPEILRESGAELVEVGTTNRTHERDYLEALDEETGLLLKVHTSNYRVVGFTSEVPIERLAEIGREHGVPVVHDLGSGCLVDLAAHGRPGEHTVQASIAAGADLVCFSGDKLLGGPQAGLIAGTRDAVERCKRHPLFRALRPGRLIYAALEATLRVYLEGEASAIEKIPALERLLTDEDALRDRAQRLARRLGRLDALEVTVVPSESQAGSGSLPARDFASWAVRVVPLREPVDELAARLRRGDPSVLGRTRDDALLLDVRTLEDDAVRLVAECFEALDVAQSSSSSGS